MRSKERVLIVDDERFNINILLDLLSETYDTMVAKSGEQALKRVRSARPPDLILLDIMMPGMDGYEVCRQLKADEVTRHIPVIFVTAMGTTTDETKGLKLGAVDYITKPISPPIVEARVMNHLTLSRTKRELSEKNRIMLKEREFIESIITRMRDAASFDRKRLRYLDTPVEKTAGDLLLAAFRPDGGHHVMVGDFTGHGLPAAIGGPMVADIFYAMTAKGLPMVAVFEEINRKLSEKMPSRVFLAASFLEFSPARDRLTVWNCSTPDILLYRQGRPHARLPSTFMPRGILVRPEKPGTEVEIQAGDHIFSFTDGIIETRAPDGSEFGLDAFETVLTDLLAQNGPLEGIHERLRTFRGGGEQADDITLVDVIC